VAEKKPFLLRVDRELLEQLQRWANDDLRSVNAQIEFVLRDALRRAGRAATSTDALARPNASSSTTPLSSSPAESTHGPESPES